MLSGNLGSARFESVPADIDSIVGVDGAIEGDDDSFFSKAVTTPKAIGDRARWEQNVPRKWRGEGIEQVGEQNVPNKVREVTQKTDRTLCGLGQGR